MESRWSGVSVSLSEAGGHSEARVDLTRSERRKSGLSDEIAVDEVLQLFGGLHGGAGATLA